MAYRANVTDKQQTEMERAENDSSMPLQWWRDGTTGEKRNIRAYDLQAQGDSGGSPSSAVSERQQRQRLIIGSHNDHPNRFATPGKA